jgi:hypothetical protein
VDFLAWKHSLQRGNLLLLFTGQLAIFVSVSVGYCPLIGIVGESLDLALLVATTVDDILYGGDAQVGVDHRIGAVGVIGVISMAFRYSKVSLRGEVGFAYE